MKKNILLISFIAICAIGAQLGSLNRTADVTTATELQAYAVDPTSIQDQITVLADYHTDGVTSNYVVVATDTLVISNGVIVGIQ